MFSFLATTFVVSGTRAQGQRGREAERQRSREAERQRGREVGSLFFFVLFCLRGWGCCWRPCGVGGARTGGQQNSRTAEQEGRKGIGFLS